MCWIIYPSSLRPEIIRIFLILQISGWSINIYLKYLKYKLTMKIKESNSDGYEFVNFESKIYLIFIDAFCYGTITYQFMDSSKSYVNRELSNLVGWSVVVVRLDREWIFDWQVNLAYATTFLCILLLQYILKLIPCSELSFRGPKLGPRHI